MEYLQLEKIQSDVENIWKNRHELGDCSVKKAAKVIIREVIELLDSGRIRVAEKLSGGKWVVHTWIKQAILLHFLTEESKIIGNNNWWCDKIKISLMDGMKKGFASQKLEQFLSVLSVNLPI